MPRSCRVYPRCKFLSRYRSYADIIRVMKSEVDTPSVRIVGRKSPVIKHASRLQDSDPANIEMDGSF